LKKKIKRRTAGKCQEVVYRDTDKKSLKIQSGLVVPLIILVGRKILGPEAGRGNNFRRENTKKENTFSVHRNAGKPLCKLNLEK
jgi:hypothetical protein